MKKIFALLGIGLSLSASAQTLFYYGKDSVTVAEFMRAYQKNNTGAASTNALHDYLDLYTASRLKIAEAKALGYDTLPQMVADLENLRQQIMPSYLVDKETMNRLMEEAFQRQQKDIKLAHIFISTKNSTAHETAIAEKRAQDAMAALNKGQAFAEVARQYSDDPTAKTNGGALGWITVFSLPYELETLAYNTPVGKTSSLYRSLSGFHIFKNEAERKAIGTMKAAQILLAFPPGTDGATKAQLKKRADSIYNRLQKGDDFGKLAASFSNDVVSAASAGQMPQIGVGQYDAVFEQNAFALAKDGAVAPPFETEYGIHIVKRLSKQPIAVKKSDEILRSLKEKVEASDRIKAVKAELVKKILQQASFHKLVQSEGSLWSYTDSILASRAPAKEVTITPQTAVASFNQKVLTSADWVGFAQSFRYKTDGSGVKAYPQLWNEFVEAQAMDYYQKHLEDFNEDFRQQFNEFKEGNLFFEIMQRQIWGPAQTDSAGLANYYEHNKQQYQWKQSAAAVIFYAADSAAAKTFLTALKKSPSGWQQLVNNMSDKISADSGRFELEQLPNATKGIKAGSITPPLVNKTDNSTSFAYITKLYPSNQPRSFAEAKGLVINDYQTALEKKWIQELKKKYPVRMNEEELKKLSGK